MSLEADYIDFKSPIGVLKVIANQKSLLFVINKKNSSMASHLKLSQNSNNKILKKTITQLEQYFSGKRQKFNLPLDLSTGTSFQQQSWKALQKIPCGTTISYKEQAEMLGDKNKARAVGSANGKNPFLIVVPCHRVIATGGHLGGFSAGLSNKVKLLEHEQSCYI